MPRVEGVCGGPVRSAPVRAERSARYCEDESFGGTLRAEVSTCGCRVNKVRGRDGWRVWRGRRCLP